MPRSMSQRAGLYEKEMQIRAQRERKLNEIRAREAREIEREQKLGILKFKYQHRN